MTLGLFKLLRIELGMKDGKYSIQYKILWKTRVLFVIIVKYKADLEYLDETLD